jgi:hypothetical protein
VTTAYPLAWPAGFARSQKREAGAFKTTLPRALSNVQTSLRLFGKDSGKPVSAVVLSSNVTLGEHCPADPGVAVYFTWEGLQVCIPVDRYSTVEANLQAIHHIVEARRVELRHGTLALVRASFRGFTALPPPNDWRRTLEIPDGPVSRETIEAAYRRLARIRHPDAGGSHIAMADLNAAKDAALCEYPA